MERSHPHKMLILTTISQLLLGGGFVVKYARMLSRDIEELRMSGDSDWLIAVVSAIGTLIAAVGLVLELRRFVEKVVII